jgi:hypothetical protein
MWLTPLDGLQVGGSVQALRFDFDYVLPPQLLQQLRMAGTVPADFAGNVAAKLPAVLWLLSLEYQAEDLLLAAEYSRWHVKIETDLPAAFPVSRTVSERFYAMASYRFTPWFTPGVYYSVFFPNADERKGRAASQHDASATLRFDLNAHWLLKLEGHFMHGTAGLEPALNDNEPRSALTRDWGVLLLKTTAYF